MSLPWHIPLEAIPAFKDHKDKFMYSSIQKHYCNLHVHESPCEELQTGLMCDINVVNREVATIQRLIASGMTIARINMREVEPEARAHLVQSIRQAVYNYSAELEYVYPLALIVDIKGPDIVTGDLKNGPTSTVEIVKHSTIRLTTDYSWRECGTSECLWVGYDHLTDLNRGDVIFIDSLVEGKIKLVVSQVGNDSIECSCAEGGIVGPKMTVRIVQVPQDNNSYSKGDSSNMSLKSSNSTVDNDELIEQQIAWVVASDMDAVLVSNTQTIHDVKFVKDALGEKGKHILVFSCIETILGMDKIDEILTFSDGIYLDRSLLSLDLPVEKIFIAQKMIVSKCNEAGKPIIIKAVINEQLPSLCVTDVANLVLDGADVLALELHYDSPLKKFAPSYDAVKMAEHCMAAAGVICRHAERVSWQPRIYGNPEMMQSPILEPTKAVCISAVELAMRSYAVAIIALTSSGRTAKIISHVKPSCPVIAVTRACHTARQLRFYKGVRAVHYFEVPKGNWGLEVEARVHAALDYCKAKRIIRAGDPYVIITGSRRGVGYCDSVRLLYASARNTVVAD